MFVRFDFFLSRMMAWNLPGLIIISLFGIKLIAMLLSESNVTIEFKTVSHQTDRVLSPTKLCIETISMKKNKSLIASLNKTDPSIEPCSTSEIISL